MEINFSPDKLTDKERRLTRLLAIMPGATSWSILIVMIFLSFLKPLLSAVIIIAFGLFWVLRLIYMNIFLVLSYSRLSLEKNTDWIERARGLNRLYEYWRELNLLEDELKSKKDISLMIHKRELRILEKSKEMPSFFEEIYHLVIIPLRGETGEIIEAVLKSMVEGKFPSEKILVALALEEKASNQIKQDIKILEEKYKEKFFDFLVVISPSGFGGKVNLKGEKATSAAKEAAKVFKEKGIPFENVIVSCIDAGTVINPAYFGCLTYCYMVSPGRTQASFQSLAVYGNNIWKESGFVKALNVGSSFFQIIEGINPDNLIAFPSQSVSLKTLADIGYWPPNLISSFEAMFWKAFFYYDGKYRPVPIYVGLPIAEAIKAKGFFRTIIEVYKQKRQWAAAVGNFPIVMISFLKAKDIPFSKRIKYAFKMWKAQILLAIWPFLLILLGWVTTILVGRQFKEAIFYYTAPRIKAIILILAFLSIISYAVASSLPFPKEKPKESFFKKISFSLGLIPALLLSIFLSSISVLEVQTRLIFGRLARICLRR